MKYVKNLLKLVTFAAGMVATVPAWAVVDCWDSVTDIIVHSNGRIFFTTPNACSKVWCELSGNAIFVKTGYAVLLSAKLNEKSVVFRWPGLASCDSKNDVYAIPEFVVLK